MKSMLFAATTLMLLSGMASANLGAQAPVASTTLPAWPMVDATDPSQPFGASGAHDARSDQDADSATGPNDYAATFHCPTTVEENVNGNRCPTYAADIEDVLSQPVLLVDPKNPDLIAFNALHGGHGAHLPTDQPPPSLLSRDNAVHQPHTTFQSTDAGGSWTDNRYYSPLPRDAYTEIWGTDNSAILDHRGNIYLSSVYAFRDDDGPLQYAMANWRAARINRPVEYDNDWVRIDPRSEGDAITKNTMAFDRATNQVTTVWLEGPAGEPGHIDLATATVDGSSVWLRIAAEQRIELCTDVTNAIIVSKRLYVGCYAAEGHQIPDADGNLTDGETGKLYLYSYDPKTWTRAYVGPTPFDAPGNALLANAESYRQGAMILGSAGVVDGKPHLRVSYSDKGHSWSPPSDYGAQATDQLNREAGSLLEARLNALAFVAQSGTIHMVYMERFAVSSNGALTSAPGTTPFSKSYIVAHGTGKLLGKFAFGYGDPQTRATFDARAKGLGDDVFNDQHDSIVLYGAPGHQRIYLAFGDHGTVRFAEVEEVNPPLPILLIAPPVPPIPAALPAANPAVVGAVAGALSLSIAARLAASRNKKAAEAPTL